MKILFLCISAIPHVGSHSVSLDVLHEFQRNGHEVYIVAGADKKAGQDTFLAEEAGCQILRVRAGKHKKANPIIKGIATVLLPHFYKSAIKKYFSDVDFDLVLYATPPITHYSTVKYIKKRDNAASYLLLKDIFPQNAVDIGMMRKSGVKGLLYKYFRRKEKKLYALSDHIGCMSQANVDYLLRHNPEIDPAKVEICPNTAEVQDMRVSAEDRTALRTKYGIPQDKKVFVYGGNLGKPQGISFVMDCLKAQKDNPDAFFLIVGDGTEYKKLQAFFEAENLPNAKLLQRLPREDYNKMVAACDVGLIFLDHRFTIPNFPSRLLSYLQAGLPVLCCTDPNTDIGSTCVDGGFGWWCESNDVSAFSDLVQTALTADLKAMGETGFAYISEHYTAERSYRTITSHFGGE